MLAGKRTSLVSSRERRLCADVGHPLGAPTFLKADHTSLGSADRDERVPVRGSEARLRLIVESARDYAIFTTDRQDRISDWMPGAAAVFG
jgi:PAS domain-containing protein